jgi:uncharacterized protein (DUF2249 family)
MSVVKTFVDVRPVAPKDRFDMIMGAYDSLSAGEALQLTVDHDPECMYYTLLATHGESAFTFDYLERGPEMWCVVCRKLQDATVTA